MKAESLMARYGEHWDTKTKCTVMIAMAVSERKNGKLDSAMARCEEAMTIAMEKHDRASQVKGFKLSTTETAYFVNSLTMMRL